MAKRSRAGERSLLPIWKLLTLAPGAPLANIANIVEQAPISLYSRGSPIHQLTKTTGRSRLVALGKAI